jgi:N-acetylated-alpha-linked acidic dipeptidase
MEHFGDPDFSYETALARILGVIALRFDEADVLPFDYSAYASEIARADDNITSRAASLPGASAILKALADAVADFSEAATHADDALASLSSDPTNGPAINRDLVDAEQALLAPQGLSRRPWYKHTVFAPGSNTGYASEIFPGVTEALQHHDLAELQRESDSLAAALLRAAARLNDASALARAASGLDQGH